MRLRHIPVKHDYAPAAVFAHTGARHIGAVKHLARIRRARGYSQAQLAERAEVNQGTISKMENGTLNPSLEMIQKIADALEVEPQELFDLPELKARALAALGRLPGEKLEAAVVVLESMAGAIAPAEKPPLKRSSR